MVPFLAPLLLIGVGALGSTYVWWKSTEGGEQPFPVNPKDIVDKNSFYLLALIPAAAIIIGVTIYFMRR